MDDELDFADAAAAEFHIATEFMAANNLGLDALFHGGDLAEHPFGDETRVTEGLDHFQEFMGEGGVAGDAAGLDQHHAFPGLAPLSIVVFVAGQRPCQGPVFAFGSQPEIDPVEGAFRVEAGEFGDEVLDQTLIEAVAGKALGDRTAFGRLGIDVSFVQVNEQQIDVGTEVKFLATQLAHAEDAKPGGFPLIPVVAMIGSAVTRLGLVPHHLVHGVDADIRNIGDFADDLGRRAQAGQVAGGDSERLALFEKADQGQSLGGVVLPEERFQESADFAAESFDSAGML